jgi:hypothetical protein
MALARRSRTSKRATCRLSRSETEVILIVNSITPERTKASRNGRGDTRHGGVSVLLAVAAIVAGFRVSSSAGPFVLFPKAVELRSPDGRFVVRNVEREGPATEFVGVCHSLWLVEVAANRSSKLCNYLGVAAIAWSNNDFVVITEYVTKSNITRVNVPGVRHV